MHPNLLIGGRADDYRCFLDRLISLLSEESRVALSIKTFPEDAERGSPLNIWFSKTNPDIHVVSERERYGTTIDSSRLTVHTYDGTTFLESIHANNPCILALNPKISPLRESAKPYYEKLKHTGIFHESPESAAEHIDSVYGDVWSWWEEENINNAKREFCDQFARRSENAIDDIGKLIKEITNESS